ncbi:PAS sensor protein [Actinomadura craniellae]|uniref:protein-serine/threonine phosphatase n=1 Tax=Actinomadura craniellae TaxID=2231787 RepID=A0A365H8Z2_9ACTN|nr:SpoIIE family protein phosphatase [Actinomadura craniellae]RAY15557.1 PAS sensor protein [Actinomadura craniellae]
MVIAIGETELRDRLAFIGAAGERIDGSLDHVHAATMLSEVLVPELADFACVQLLERVVRDYEMAPEQHDELTLTRRLAVVHNDEPDRWGKLVPEGETLRLPAASPFIQAMRARRTIHLANVERELADRIAANFTGGRDLRPLIRGRTLLVVPLVARDQVLGGIALMRKPDRPPFDEIDQATIEELCRRTALCIENTRLYRREVRVAQELQRSLLPEDPPEVAGARVRFRYQPAGQAAQVGGDWFDAIPLTGGRLGIVVGDVMGHGLTSAAIMGQLRTAVRTLAGQDPRPDRLLSLLDELAQRLGEGCIATCLYAVYDPIARTCQIANAGHMLPVLVEPGGGACEPVQLPAALPIGVGGVPFETVEIPVPDGARLVLFTDGLIERRGRDIDEGVAALCKELAGAPPSLDDACDQVIESLAPAVPIDDIALVAVGCDGIPAEDVAFWELPAEPAMVGRVRAEVAERLAGWGLSELTDSMQLLVSELVTNALVHGAGAITLRLIRANSLLCEVGDDGQELPYLCDASLTDESGRGLQLVGYIAERWGVRRTDHGKIVWFEHVLP